MRAAIEQREDVTPLLLDALTILVVEERLSRDQVIEYFHSLFHCKLVREPHFIWSALVVACCDLCPQELLREIEQAYGDYLVDAFHIQLESVQETLASGKMEILRQSKQYRRGFIEDTVAEVSWWASFDEGTNASARELPTNAKQPIVKDKKIGRSDPCPCGSGKKYKKCCLQQKAASSQGGSVYTFDPLIQDSLKRRLRISER